MSNHNEKPEQCDACHYITDALHPAGGVPMQEEVWLCDLCNSTMSGNRAIFPRLPYEDGAVLSTICYVGNVILAELRKRPVQL